MICSCRKCSTYDYGSQKLTAFLIPYYIVYEFVIWSRLRGEIKAGRFALVHRLDPVSPVLASPLLLADAQSEDTFLAWAHEWRSALASGVHKRTPRERMDPISPMALRLPALLTIDLYEIKGRHCRFLL